MKIGRILYLLLAALLLAACSDDEETSSGYPVSFSMDASVHPYNIVHGYGEFIVVTRSGASAYKVAYGAGEEKIENMTELQMQQGLYFGLGGLVIGTPSACDGNVWAFDLACPKCDSQSKKLDVSLNTGVAHAHCAKCGSKYDLNSGGVPIEGETRTMWRYKVLRNDPYIIVQN